MILTDYKANNCKCEREDKNFDKFDVTIASFASNPYPTLILDDIVEDNENDKEIQ